jgi:hypothetical protein
MVHAITKYIINTKFIKSKHHDCFLLLQGEKKIPHSLANCPFCYHHQQGFKNHKILNFSIIHSDNQMKPTLALFFNLPLININHCKTNILKT